MRFLDRIGRVAVFALLLNCVACEKRLAATPQHPPQQYQNPPAADNPQMLRFDGAPSTPSALVLAGLVDGQPDQLWKWTNRKAEFRFWPGRTPVTLEADFDVAESTLEQTGPITLTVMAGGTEIGKSTEIGKGSEIGKTEIGKKSYATPQRVSLQLPIPASLITAGAPLDVSLNVNPPWVSPTDKVELGVQLRRIGIVSR